MPSSAAGKGEPLPFEALRMAGLSDTNMRRLERYRQQQEERGADVFVIRWPDTTWCVLALHCAPLSPALANEQIAELYTNARMMIRDGYLPKLVLRFDPSARH